MELKPITSKQLDQFAKSQPNSQLLQSSAWADFQKSLGHKVWQFGLFKNEEIIASAVIIKHVLPTNKSYLYCPRGPVISQKLTETDKQTALEFFLSKARDITIETASEEEIFFRFEPTNLLPPATSNLKPTQSIQPADTLLLDLQLTKDQLLAEMHPKTRYNIRLAEKHQVKIQEEKDFNLVWPVFEKTSQRDEFNLHPKNYYLKMLASIPEIKLLTAVKDNKMIAANLVSFFGDTVTYLHGSSDHEFRKFMAPFLLQWHSILKAKNAGFTYYDFHGIAPQLTTHDSRLTKQHPWAGITRFKKGFGGQEINYPGAFDFIYQPNWYKIYKVFRKINKIVR